MSIHPTAIVHPHAELGDNVEIGPFCVIDENVKIGSGCRLGHNVYVTGWTRIGENCRLHPGAIVGHEPQDVRYRGERSFCTIGRGTILREYVTIHRGTDPDAETVLGEECLLFAGAHVAHNCVLGRKVTLVNDVLLGGHVQIGDGAFLSGRVGVHQFVRVGELVMVPGIARVLRDAVPFALLDLKGHIAGLNRVGLRRADFSRREIDAVRNAYRALFAGSKPIQQAARELAATETAPAVARLLEFVLAESRRGLVGRARQSDDADDASE